MFRLKKALFIYVNNCVRAIGPVLSGALFTWGIDIGYVIVPWWTLALFGILGHIPTWWILDPEGFGASDEDKGEEEENEFTTLINTPQEPEENLLVFADSALINLVSTIDFNTGSRG